VKYSYNHVTIMGRLTRNPELKQITDTVTKTYFTVAVDRHYKRHDGSIETDFIPVSFFGKFADISYQLLKKGCLVLIWGKVQVTNYEKDGERKTITEIIADNFQVLTYPKNGQEMDPKPEIERDNECEKSRKKQKQAVAE